MDLGVQGRRAAVAAGSAGLGLASARALVDEGVQVVICGRDRARVDAATDRLQQIYRDGLPDRPMGDPADFGQVVAFLCSEQARFVTGVQLHVDGGDYAGLQ